MYIYIYIVISIFGNVCYKVHVQYQLWGWILVAIYLLSQTYVTVVDLIGIPSEITLVRADRQVWTPKIKVLATWAVASKWLPVLRVYWGYTRCIVVKDK